MFRYLFIDMNSFFASVEQQDRPALRGRPIAVVPVRTDTTSVIAASYEAKAFGVRTGTKVADARQLCPGLVLIEGRHQRYVEVHHQILSAVENCLHVDRVMSIDEMACRLLGSERTAAAATALALRIKETLRKQVGSQLRCSIGIASNVTLAKVAADLQKPDGLTLLPLADLPTRLWTLQLQDLPGIGPRMFKRLRNRGVTSVRQLTELGAAELAGIWESKVLGQRWWLTLRGEDVLLPESPRRSVGHSHVLAPHLRSATGAWLVLQRLLQKAAWRLRSYGRAAQTLAVQVRFLGGSSWQTYSRMEPLADTLSLQEVVRALWRQRPAGTPLKVGVTLGDLVEIAKLPKPMFERDRRRLAFSHAVDEVNQKFGPRAAYLGGIHGMSELAPSRIAFTQIPELATWNVEN